MALNRPRERTIKGKATGTPNTCNVTFTVDASDLKFKNDVGGNPRPGYIVYFDLEEDPGLDSKFHEPDPMWVEPIAPGQNACPSSPCSWDQFRAIDIINGGKTLMVRNENDYEHAFAFTLRFDVPGCTKVLECDPIGNNQNGKQQ